ncbi:MAG: DUF2946 domain-containing protein [Rhodospirillales bacterium]|nr:DUF2946 domain-containing protein [Alphaproteobacteria bacterium]USO04281.1 MAG: DUF2946 domain-containing protein [Rhodospirillales bacterium]
MKRRQRTKIFGNRRGFGAFVAVLACLAFVLSALFPPCKVLNAKSFVEICTAQGIEVIALSDNGEEAPQGDTPSFDLCPYCAAQSSFGANGLFAASLAGPESFSALPLPVPGDSFAVSRHLFSNIQSRAPPVLS